MRQKNEAPAMMQAKIKILLLISVNQYKTLVEGGGIPERNAQPKGDVNSSAQNTEVLRLLGTAMAEANRRRKFVGTKHRSIQTSGHCNG
jgi:hypothetical protein